MQSFRPDIGTSVNRTLEALKMRFQRTTMRERVLIACLVIGASLYAPIATFEYRNTQAEAYVNALSDQATARLTLNTARRIAEGAADQAILADMKSWGFEASNANIAQVLIEQRLVEAAGDVGLTGLTISTSNTVEAIGPTQWMSAEVQADLRWSNSFAFLDHLGAWPEGFRVTSFRYQLNPTNPLMPSLPEAPLGKVQFGLSFPVNVPAPDAAS